MYAKEAHGGRSLFIANIPAFYNKGVLADAFVEYGTVLDARLDESEPGKTRCGIVTFAESIAAQELLATASDSLQLPSKRARDDTGVVKRLLAGHRANMLSTEALQEAADSCMLLFEKQEERDSARRSDLRGNGPDEDGFVTVTHKGKLRYASIYPVCECLECYFFLFTELSHVQSGRLMEGFMMPSAKRRRRVRNSKTFTDTRFAKKRRASCWNCVSDLRKTRHGSPGSKMPESFALFKVSRTFS
jgi:hypothetical protein